MTTSTLQRARLRFPSAVPAAIGLVVGFGVAQASGNRAAGGVVFAVGGLVAGLLWRERRGTRVAVGLAAVYLGAFVLAHVLALAVGWPAWLAVGVVTLVSAGLSLAIADLPRETAGRP